MDISKPKALLVVEAILSSFEFTQYQLWKQTGVSFGQVNKVVNYLVKKGAVGKVGKRYQVTSYGWVLQLFLAHRTFPKPVATFQITIGRQEIFSYLAEQGCTFCLTTAWQQYDDYLHEGAVHAYLPADDKIVKKVLAELSAQPNGLQLVQLYLQDLPVKPAKALNKWGKGKQAGKPFEEPFKPLKYLPVTSEIRTLLDMYSSHYAYGVQNWITHKVEQWQRK